MNPERERLDSLAAQMDKQVTQRARAREHEGIQPILAEMKIGGTTEGREALQALMRSALVSGDASPLAPEISVKVVGITGDLERDGCDFLKMAYLFLTILECPAEVRDLVLAVCALSGGNSEEFRVMTDIQIGELIGYHRNQIKKKRETLIEWQTKSTYALVDIIEKERDPVTRHYLPTEYRARIVPIIAQFIRRARSLRLRNENYAQRNVVEKGYHEIVGELSSTLPISPLIQRREPPKSFAKPQQQQQTLLTGQQEQVIVGMMRHLHRVMDMDVNPNDVWREIRADVEASLYKMTLNTKYAE